MFPLFLLRGLLYLLIPVSVILTVYLHLYPIFHLCAFPLPQGDASSSYLRTLGEHFPLSLRSKSPVAPFRLLALGDPQLEGDSSIPGASEERFPHFPRIWEDLFSRDGDRVDYSPLQRVRNCLHNAIDFWLDDIPVLLELFRKRVDHFGNDYYLGHIYRTMHWWTNPTHVTVLGDLVGSQWIDDEEFERRGSRFWNRVFRGGHRVSDDLAADPQARSIEALSLVAASIEDWKTRIMNVAGNHDIGYAGDLDQERMDRFHRVFGNPNYELRFQLPNVRRDGSHSESSEEDPMPIPELRIVVINDMNLDTPATSQPLQASTYAFLNGVITTSNPVERRGLFTLVLTHIPMFKPAGVCVDAPFFAFFDGENGYGNGVKEQNHLSASASGGFLEGLFGKSGNKDVPGQGKGRNGMILTGHDHEGCDVYHYINQTVTTRSKVEQAPKDDPSFDPSSEEPPKPTWQSTTWPDAKKRGLPAMTDLPGLHEVTVRSMMGEFGGNAGLLSVWFDESTWEWQSEFTNCALGTQHIWWAIHVVDLITFIAIMLYSGIQIAIRYGDWDADAWWSRLLSRQARGRSNAPLSKPRSRTSSISKAVLLSNGNPSRARISTRRTSLRPDSASDQAGETEHRRSPRRTSPVRTLASADAASLHGLVS